MDATIFGVIVADLIGEPMDLRHPPAPGGLTALNSLSIHPGGNACNVAISMAKLGMRVATAGLVADDALGKIIVDRLQKSGVDTSCVFTDGRDQTPATIVAVQPDGERSFFHKPGLLAHLDAATFRRCFDLFRRCAWIKIGYFGLVPALTPDLPELLREFRVLAPATKIALDTNHPPADRALLDPILPHVDLFVPSRAEAIVLTGEREPKRMIAAFRQAMPRGSIAIKLDAEGCCIDDGSQMIFSPAYPVNVVDTTGAGDAWFAGLLTGLIKGMPLAQCTKLANRVAADSCTMFSGSAGVRNFEETVARM